jgi:uncharacterized membrane protein YdjX (TVP38/TMEM64 family)
MAAVTKKQRIWIGIGIGLVLLGLALWTYREQILAAFQLASDPQALESLLDQYGAYGIALSVLLLVLQVFLAVIPGQALVIATGYVYGFWMGLIISWTSVVLASELAFWLARRYGRPLVVRFVSPASLGRWDNYRFNQNILFYVVTMLLPLFPNDGMCYVAGLTRMAPLRFLVANMIARGITCLALVYVGAFGHSLPPWAWAVIAAFVALLLLVSWIARRKLLPAKKMDTGQ